MLAVDKCNLIFKRRCHFLSGNYVYYHTVLAIMDDFGSSTSLQYEILLFQLTSSKILYKHFFEVKRIGLNPSVKSVKITL